MSFSDYEKNALAEEVLEAVRRSLMVSYRFLDRALFKMKFESREGIELIGCDGKTIFYNAGAVLERYQNSSDECARDFLHMILHCVFYHPFVGNDVSPHMWSLASDIVVEQAALEMAGEKFASEYDARRKRILDSFAEEFGSLSAEKLYRHFLQEGIDGKEASLLSALFTRDDHGIWFHDLNPEKNEDETENVDQTQPTDDRYTDDDAPDATFDDPHDIPDMIDAGGLSSDEPNRGQGTQSDTSQQTEGESDSGDDTADQEEEQVPAQDQAQAATPQEQEDSENLQSDSQQFDDGPDESSREEWENISKQMKVDLETRSQAFGSKAGSLIQQIAIVNRHDYDYRDFLRRFAEIGEEMRISDTDFDPIYYTYGLERYGNMPLIEPLEFREVERIREFVIAIDTSGSVEGALVKRFVEETFNILTSVDSFFTDVKIRIMQCDARVQHEMLVTNLDDFERYMRTFQVQGFGGTDFRPVFNRVNEYIELGEIENLRGLIYFTDGFGQFPSTPPPYETVFVFVTDGTYAPNVPSWAYKLALTDHDLM